MSSNTKQVYNAISFKGALLWLQQSTPDNNINFAIKQEIYYNIDGRYLYASYLMPQVRLGALCYTGDMKYKKVIGEIVINETYKGKTLKEIVSTLDGVDEEDVYKWMIQSEIFEKAYLRALNVSYPAYFNKAKDLVSQMINNITNEDLELQERKFKHTVLKDVHKSLLDYIKALGIDKQFQVERLASSQKRLQRNIPEIQVGFTPPEKIAAEVTAEPRLLNETEDIYAATTEEKLEGN